MNNKIKLAVAGAVLASASVANAGITWEAGEWTVDMNGNVNAFANMTNADDSATVSGGLAGQKGNDQDIVGIETGLLPSWLGFTATTRQNDLDTSVTISFQPNAGGTTSLTKGNANNGTNETENRQAFLTFGDKSWGSVKVGKDLGIFGSTAILNDMTLLGVGGGAGGGGGNTTLGGIGTGYLYADWIGQIAYTTPNMNGFQATLGITQPWTANTALSTTTVSSGSAGSNDEFGFQGQGSFSWTGDFAGKVWAGFFSQNVENIADGATGSSDTSTALEVGVSTSIYNINLVAYGYSGDGLGTTSLLGDAYDITGDARDSDGGYVQATYVIPMGTKLGVSYGISKLDDNTADATVIGQTLVEENSMLTVGAYHPLTKHLNLVAEYSKVESEAHANLADLETDIVSVGAILFF